MHTYRCTGTETRFLSVAKYILFVTIIWDLKSANLASQLDFKGNDFVPFPAINSFLNATFPVRLEMR